MVCGIDVSEHNGRVDWMAVVEGGMSFALIRLGYGQSYIDPEFLTNLAGAAAAGLSIGIYHYSYALQVDEAVAEANWVRQVLKRIKIVPELGIWFDMEDADGYKTRRGMPSPDTITAMCSAFICQINEAGYSCGIYASYSWLRDIIRTEELGGYVPYWNAQWGNTDDWQGRLWQYTNLLSIKGQLFDGNILYD